jgi:hypothetical protein
VTAVEKRLQKVALGWANIRHIFSIKKKIYLILKKIFKKKLKKKKLNFFFDA